MKYLFFIFFSFNSLSVASELTAGSDKEAAERSLIEQCDTEVRAICDFSPFEIQEERECISANISNLSSQCSLQIERALDRSRPVEPPKFIGTANN